MADYLREALTEIFAGSCAGIISKIAEFPLDTVKVYMQHPELHFTNAWDASRHIYKSSGIRGFYQGLGAPVIGAGMEDAVNFVAFGRAMAAYRWFSGNTGDDVPIPAYWGAGAFTGGVVSFVLTPVELVKCRLQIQDASGSGTQRQYNGVIDCCLKIWRNEGPKVFFTNGLTSTLAREVPGNCAWFGVYATLMQLAKKRRGETEPSLTDAAICGGFSGIAYWTIFYPADVVKTRVQTASAHVAKETLSQGLKNVYQQKGFRGLYKGWGVTVVRAFPAHALIFVTYEFIMSQLGMHSV